MEQTQLPHNRCEPVKNGLYKIVGIGFKPVRNRIQSL